MGVPFLFHWKVGAGVPVAAAVSVTVAPTDTLCDCGCAVKLGIVDGGVTLAAATFTE